jgi:hypothetical protein
MAIDLSILCSSYTSMKIEKHKNNKKTQECEILYIFAAYTVF